MRDVLYLDTARLGQMCSRASRAAIDFARYSGEFGSLLYFSDFLEFGAEVWPRSLRQRFPSLAEWSGIEQFRKLARQIAGAPPSADVLVASRSAALVRYATELLRRRCRNVLTIDATWPSYSDILRETAASKGFGVTKLNLRRQLYWEHLDARALSEHIANHFVEHKCDGLFIPFVDNLGIRFPIRQIVSNIEQHTRIRCAIFDAAQALNHVPLALEDNYWDFIISGCHKWLQAGKPLRIGFANERLSRNEPIRIDDTLMQLCHPNRSKQSHRFGETFDTTPLIAANAAMLEVLGRNPSADEVGSNNASKVIPLARDHNWSLRSPHESLRSRILLFQGSKQRRCGDAQLENAFYFHGVRLTAFADGVIRLALPTNPLCRNQLHQLESGFAELVAAKKV